MWVTPSLKQVRIDVRNDVTAGLGGAAKIGNGVARVMADAMSGLAHLCLRYLDYIAKNMLPDTAEVDWLDRHGDIWLVNADGSVGRKGATLAVGTVTMTSTNGTLVASGTQLQSNLVVGYETTEQITLGSVATAVAVRALDPGAQGNLDPGDSMELTEVISGVDSSAVVVEMSGGMDAEADEDLRSRVLWRIRNPPMGGDAADFVAWATSISGVTRAWCSPLELGAGTVTVRFMMDDIRSGDGGIPNASDVVSVTTYIDSVRPVAIKDMFVLAPIPMLISFTITDLEPDTVSIRAGIEVSVIKMLRNKAAPAYALNGIRQSAQTIYAAWVSDAIMDVTGVKFFTLQMSDTEMPSNGHIAVLGTIFYDPS